MAKTGRSRTSDEGDGVSVVSRWPTCDAAFRLEGTTVRCDREALHSEKDDVGHAIGSWPRLVGGGAALSGQQSLATGLIAAVERVAKALYEHEMGQATWPLPYESLTVRQQAKWRGDAYATSYEMARCPVTRTVHPWFYSYCSPECRPVEHASDDTPAPDDPQSPDAARSQTRG